MVGYDAAGNVICQVTNRPVPEEYKEFIGMFDPAGRIQIVTLDYGKTTLSESIDNLYFAPGPAPEDDQAAGCRGTALRRRIRPGGRNRHSSNEVFAAQALFPAPQLWTVNGPDGAEFVQFAVPGLEPADGTPGLPDVRFFRRILAVPRGAKAVLTGVRPVVGDELNALLYPVQESPVDAMPRPGRPAQRGTVRSPPSSATNRSSLDKEAYAGEDKFPSQIVSIEPLGRMRDLDLVQVNIAAGQYFPAKQALTIFNGRVRDRLRGRRGRLPA